MTLYKKFMNRSLPLFACEYWEKGERESLKKVCDGVFFCEPFFCFRPNEGVSISYNWTDERQDTERLAEYFRAHPESFPALEREYLERCDRIRFLVERRDSKDFQKLFDELVELWPMLVMGNLLGQWDPTTFSPDLRQQFYDLRIKTDRVFYNADAAMLDMAKDLVGHSDVEFLLMNEIWENRMPSAEELASRKKGFVYFLGELSTRSAPEIARAHDIEFEEIVADEAVTEFKGQITCAGKVTGIVKVLFERSQMGKVQNGDIVVAPMTTPDFMTAISLASAIITDEGGITCHAAIVARELGKPCIIGTKIATQVLKDGDMVEVDANTGVVRIISPGE